MNGKCPRCLADAYIGFSVVECSNPHCDNYDPVHIDVVTDFDDDSVTVEIERDIAEWRARQADKWSTIDSGW